MATIADVTTQVELFPRKKVERDEDPFIYSFFRIFKNEKALLDVYTPLLLQSEYRSLSDGLSLLLEDKSSSFSMESIQPFFHLLIHQQQDLYTWTIMIEESMEHEKMEVIIQCTKKELDQFHHDLSNEMSAIQESSWLP